MWMVLLTVLPGAAADPSPRLSSHHRQLPTIIHLVSGRDMRSSSGNNGSVDTRWEGLDD